MYPKINLTGIKHCNQIWDEMQDGEKGRLCSKCNNVIIDFRGKTDWLIALEHVNSEKKVCGIYDKKALTGNEKPKTKQSNKSGLLVAGVLGLFTTNFPAFSQNSKEQLKEELAVEIIKADQSNEFKIQENGLKALYNNQKSISYLINGVLTDKLGEPLVGGIILIKGTELGAITNVGGQFKIEIPENIFKMDSITIVASYISYGREELEISKIDFNQKNELELKISMDEKVGSTVFSVKRPPFYKRVAYGIKNIFWKKTK